MSEKNIPINAAIAATPYYVLMDGKCRIGPNVVPLDSGMECLSIYAFAGKASYDEFCRNSQLALKPYPLVTRYLREQVEKTGERLNLVVIDAVGPDEHFVHAATMNAVLEAHESQVTELTEAYRLVFDEATNAYRISELRASS